MKAIFVDDEPFSIKAFLRLSQKIPQIDLKGYFSNPFEALEFAGKEPIDLAILDIEMPGMKGTELARKLKELYPGIFVVFITAYDEYQNAAADADDYIIKPYNREALENMVRKLELKEACQKNV